MDISSREHITVQFCLNVDEAKALPASTFKFDVFLARRKSSV